VNTEQGALTRTTPDTERAPSEVRAVAEACVQLLGGGGARGACYHARFLYSIYSKKFTRGSRHTTQVCRGYRYRMYTEIPVRPHCAI
jgi:hypothetical protein